MALTAMCSAWRSLVRASGAACWSKACPRALGFTQLIYPLTQPLRGQTSLQHMASGVDPRLLCFWPEAVGASACRRSSAKRSWISRLGTSVVPRWIGFTASSRQIACKQGSHAFGRSAVKSCEAGYPTQLTADLGITSDSSSLEANMLTASTASLVPLRICRITRPA